MDVRPGDMQCSVHIVDDDDGARIGLARVINASGLQAVEYRSAQDYLCRSEHHDDIPACVLLDWYLPDSNGLEVLNTLTAKECSAPVVLISGSQDIANAVSAIRAGAAGFLVKPVTAETLLAAVHRAIDEGIRRRRDHQRSQELHDRYQQLTSREKVVFVGLVSGKLNKQIAGDLGTCVRTVKTYRSHIMHKLQARSIVDLVRIADMLGLSDRDQPNIVSEECRA